MNLKNLLSVAITTGTLLLLSGCAHYKAIPLNRLTFISPTTTGEQSVSMVYRIFSKNDCKKYLDRDVISKGFQPIQVTLKNNSERCYYFSLSNINLPCISSEEVAQTVRTSTKKRAASYGIASLFIPILIVPAVIDGFSSSEANEQLMADFSRKVLTDQAIAPYSTINGLIFVPSTDFHDQISLTIIDQESGERITLSHNGLKLAIR